MSCFLYIQARPYMATYVQKCLYWLIGVTGHFALVISPIIARSKYNIPGSTSNKTKQTRFKCDIRPSLSQKPKQVRFKCHIPRSEIGS